MDFWITFWSVLFAITMISYTGLVIVVAWGGWGDIQAMFRQLDAAKDDDKESQ